MSEDPVTGGARNVSLPLFIRQSTGPRLIGSGNCSGKTDAARPVQSATVRLPKGRKCESRRRFRIRLRAPKGQRLRSAKVFVNGKKAKVSRRKGRLTALIDLRKLRKGRFTIRIVAITGQGRRVVSQRKYRTCTPKRRS